MLLVRIRVSLSSHSKELQRPYQLHLSTLSTALCVSWYSFILHCPNVWCFYFLSLNLCSECSQVSKWPNSARLVGQEAGHAYLGRVQIKRCGSDSAKVVPAAGLRMRDLLGGSRRLWLWWEMWVTLGPLILLWRCLRANPAPAKLVSEILG